MGEMYYFDKDIKKDYKKAFTWFLKAAEQEHSYAQSMVGNMYFEGVGVARDYKKAFEWSLRAAKQKEGYSQMIVAKLYAQGLGVEKSKVNADAWYIRASINGIDTAPEALESLESTMTQAQIEEAEKIELSL